MNRYWIERQEELAYCMGEVKEDFDRYLLNPVTRRILSDFLDSAFDNYKFAEKMMKDKEKAYAAK